MKHRFTTVIMQEGKWFVARAIELGVVSQGKTIEAAERNLKEAISLYLEEGKVFRRLSRRREPLITTIEV
ncbi:MAG: type II toxin-antitoxin system HicB family antitoxin [bacterium]|nr:type II toxin-antitoxin system HicB family antitoxin [bacterium]